MTKNQRHCDDVCVGANADRISNLPDEILVGILSHLSTKEAVATSILSKRWEYLWTSTSDLEFSDQFLTARENEIDQNLKSLIFKQYVDRVIFYHGRSTLQKCTMIFHTNVFSHNIYTWICGVTNCNVKELTLMDHSLTAQQLPWILFTCKSLAVLKIKGIFVLQLPSYICFPSLKVLHLYYVALVDDDSAQRLFCSCPVLEDLVIVQQRDSARVLKISIPSLKSLTIYSEVRDARIEINAPCLQFLIHKVVLGDSSSKFLSLLIWAQMEGKLNINLLHSISQVQSIILGRYSMLRLRIIDRDFTLPTFNKLMKIELHVGRDLDWEMLLKFLKCTPNLKVLVFPSGLVNLREDELEFYRFNWHWPGFVPECLSLILHTIDIYNFVGFQEELFFIKYLLEYGKVLDKMIIHNFDFSTTPRMKKMVDVEGDRIVSEIFNCKRGSSTCEVVFAA